MELLLLFNGNTGSRLETYKGPAWKHRLPSGNTGSRRETQGHAGKHRVRGHQGSSEGAHDGIVGSLWQITNLTLCQYRMPESKFKSVCEFLFLFSFISLFLF